MDDLILKEGLVSRDRLVFEYIFNYYYSSLCAFSMQYLRDRNATEDLVQDFFVSLWVNAPNIQIRSSLKSYLFTGVKNQCLDLRKHQKVVAKYQEYILFSADNLDKTANHYFAESELRFAIQKSLEKLPPRCREIFELSRTKGLINNEISRQLGISK